MLLFCCYALSILAGQYKVKQGRRGQRLHSIVIPCTSPTGRLVQGQAMSQRSKVVLYCDTLHIPYWQVSIRSSKVTWVKGHIYFAALHFPYWQVSERSSQVREVKGYTLSCCHALPPTGRSVKVQVRSHRSKVISILLPCTFHTGRQVNKRSSKVTQVKGHIYFATLHFPLWYKVNKRSSKVTLVRV